MKLEEMLGVCPFCGKPVALSRRSNESDSSLEDTSSGREVISNFMLKPHKRGKQWCDGRGHVPKSIVVKTTPGTQG